MSKVFGVLVGGGPAPGLNGVTSAVALEARSRGYSVYGISSGFERLMQGDLTCARELIWDDVAWIHRLGGSFIRTSRANPTKDPAKLQTVVDTLKKLGITHLVTIGGDDTATSAQAVAQAAGGTIRIGHVPKTIDNDLPLPGEIPTFGYETARHTGSRIIQALMADAYTAGRWYIAIAMGRKAGHLALGMGFSGGASLTLIPEEFPREPFPLSVLVDRVVSSILKARALGRNFGVAVLAEGLLELVDPMSFPEIERAERDEHGHIRYAELDFGGIMKRAIGARLRELGSPKVTIVEKNIGYEVRCCDPDAFDIQYTRLLGYGITEFLDNEGTEAMISIQNGKFVPISFAQMLDPKTKKTAVRYVDTNSAFFRGAKSFSIRLRLADFENEALLSALKPLTNRDPRELREELQIGD